MNLAEVLALVGMFGVTEEEVKEALGKEEPAKEWEWLKRNIRGRWSVLKDLDDGLKEARMAALEQLEKITLKNVVRGKERERKIPLEEARRRLKDQLFEGWVASVRRRAASGEVGTVDQVFDGKRAFKVSVRQELEEMYAADPDNQQIVYALGKLLNEETPLA